MRNRHTLGIALALCALPAILQAGDLVKTLTVTGEGISRREAVADGLLQALAQVGGMQIVATQRDQLRSALGSVAKDGEETNVSAFLEQASKVMKTNVGGRISGYRVLSCERNADRRWEAMLEVKVPDYQTPGHRPDSRRKLAVLPLRSLNSRYEVNGRTIPGSQFAGCVQRQLVDQLTQSRRFAIVDRDYGTEYAAEKRLILSGNARVEELGKLGRVLGVDYLLVGTVEEFFAANGTTTVAIIGKQHAFAEARVRINYRVIVMATQQIKWSSTVDIPFSAELLGDDGVQFDPNAIADVAGKEIAERITENIYPIRIVNTDGGKILLNQGGVTVQIGDVFEVYNLGKMNYDPYTKEQLGRSETLAALIRVERVTLKLSYAAIVEGDIAGISDKSVCRRPQATLGMGEAPDPGRDANTQTTPGGGVVLPFDR